MTDYNLIFPSSSQFCLQIIVCSSYKMRIFSFFLMVNNSCMITANARMSICQDITPLITLDEGLQSNFPSCSQFCLQIIVCSSYKMKIFSFFLMVINSCIITDNARMSICQDITPLILLDERLQSHFPFFLSVLFADNCLFFLQNENIFLFTYGD